MILVACTCEEGFGIAHDHFDHSMVRYSAAEAFAMDAEGYTANTGVFGWIQQHDVVLNPGLEVVQRDAGIRVWVDWAELGRRATRREAIAPELTQLIRGEDLMARSMDARN